MEKTEEKFLKLSIIYGSEVVSVTGIRLTLRRQYERFELI